MLRETRGDRHPPVLVAWRITLTWAQRLHDRTVRPEEALSAVRDGHRVFIHGAAATPRTLIEALSQRLPQLADVQTVSIHTTGDAPYARPDLQQHVRHRALFIGANVRTA